MNGSGRSDASTSTEDIKARPLCLFYFTHPFGVLSPEPPRVTAAPPHVARTFLNMEPVSPFTFWSSPAEEPYDTCESSAPDSRPRYDLGAATVRRKPADSVGAPRAGRCTLGFGRRESSSSSPFSGDVWFDSDAFPRRLVPYNRMLPPLRLPSPRGAAHESSADLWPGKRASRDKLSLPPIELPAAAPASAGSGRSGRSARRRRRLGVRKPRRAAHPADLRRVLARLVHRALRGAGASAGRGVSPALRDALATVREAWAEPRTRTTRTRSSCARTPTCAVCERAAPPGVPPADPAAGTMRSPLDVDAGGLPDASPGLLRRRYSVPETIMRKYRLAQTTAEAEEGAGGAGAHRSPASASPVGEPPPLPALPPPPPPGPRASRRDRELMRRSALMRRLLGRAEPCCCRAATRSLHGSRSELRPLSALARDVSCCTYRSHERGPPSPAPARCPSVPSADAHDSPAGRFADTDEVSFTDASEVYSTALSAVQKPPAVSGGAPAAGRGGERSTGAENDERESLPFDEPLTVETPSYELLEIVVSEAADATAAKADPARPPHGDPARRPSGVRAIRRACAPGVNIDEYVSNILVESLNSLSDQLESMSASIGGDRKINIVEKEIKVKLQNAGVNTIVHLSPTSNNPIIFGNEELCHGDMRHSPPAPAPGLDVREEAVRPRHDPVDRAVLQQIQRLFEEEVRRLDGDGGQPGVVPPEISHIETSNVDVFLDEHAAPGQAPVDTLRVHASRKAEVISGVGAGNYPDARDDPVVPRFSAVPHTDSMEVNTSSDETELPGSGCTSLVDSLDDPNSPRSAPSRRALAGRRGELVRSAVDVLGLLPEHGRDQPRDKGEAFFVAIQNDERGRGGDDVRVADRMPDNIRQRLHRRQRRRELRMESARRARPQPGAGPGRRRDAQRDAQRQCAAIVGALIDDVIAKVVHDEYKCMRIKHRPDRKVESPNGTVARRSWRRDSRRAVGGASRERPANGTGRPETSGDARTADVGSETHQITGKLSFRTGPGPAPDDRGPRRLYQKSEIHEGNKCIEILEILEYATGAQSSPETPTSDENHNQRTKKSRIPVPVHEKCNRVDDNAPTDPGQGRGRGRDANANRLLADALLLALADAEVAPRTAGPRSRPDSLRFKRTFDIIPEERSSLSLESGAEDADRDQRRPAPAAPRRATPAAPARDTRSAGTSPLAREGVEARAPEASRVLERRSASTQCERGARREPVRPPRVERGEPERSRRGERSVRGAHKGPRRLERTAPEDGRPPPDSAGVDPREPAETNARSISPDRSEEEPVERVTLPECGRAGSSSSGESASCELLCPLAPRWLAPAGSRRAAHRRRAPAPPAPAAPIDAAAGESAGGAGGWSVTVAGSCRATLPADVEMRLRFPQHHPHAALVQECSCTQRSCAACGAPARLPPSPHAPPAPPPLRTYHPALARAAAPDSSRLTLTMKKEALDSSVLASRSCKKSSEPLPELETFRASRSKLKSSVKTRRAYSLHCWLPESEPAPIRDRNGLSVLGCAIIPELKPRVPTMSERDLTRVYTPRHYLRS